MSLESRAFHRLRNKTPHPPKNPSTRTISHPHENYNGGFLPAHCTAWIIGERIYDQMSSGECVPISLGPFLGPG